MSSIQIPNLPPVIALSGEELLEGVQAGSSVRISMGQIIAASAVGLPTTLPIPITAGGTGATTDAGARSNLGLGTIAIQDANSVVLTGGSINGTTIGGTTAAAGSFTTVTATTSVLSTGAGGIGYSTGAGVAVTQPTSRTTPAPTTGNKTSGAITLFTAAPVLNAWVSFTVPNTAIAITDTVSITVRGATNTYIANVTAIVAATSFTVTIASILGTASDTPIINFNIIRGVSA
jgi:hypothetical protein